MTKETQASSYVAGEYSYDGDGHRVKRKVASVETWQVYSVGGELLAEYGANTAASAPQKEYGYRNGQLLVTATSPLPGGAPSFSDNPIQVGITTVQATHITELRTAINSLRAHLGMSAYSWTQPTSTGGVVASGGSITADPIIEMRTALDQALGAPAGGYASGLAQGQPIKAIHVQELRDRLTAASGSDLRWMVTDQLGTSRIIFDQSGSLATTSRHDYLPFGEELFASTGGRTTAQGYGASDNLRQHFTQKERDNETGLDYFEARYYSSSQGRFVTVDPTLISAKSAQPQSWNRYSYCVNSPLKWIDPTGLSWFYEDHDNNGKRVRTFSWYDDDKDAPSNLTKYTEPLFYGGPDSSGGERIWLGPNGESAKLTEDQYDQYALNYAETGDVGMLNWWQLGLLQVALFHNNRPPTMWSPEEAEEGPPLFSQESVSPKFQDPGPESGQPPSPVAGMTIGDVAASLRSGALKPSDLPLEVIRRDGQLLSLNSRSLLALRRAGVPTSEYVLKDLTGNAAAEEKLTQRLLHNKMTTGSDVIRVTGLGQNASTVK